MIALTIISCLVSVYCLGGWLVESYRHDLAEAKYRSLLTEFESPE